MEAEIDVVGLSEVNVNWKYLPFHDKPYERFRGSFEYQKLYWSHNELIAASRDKYQPGGTFMLANNRISHRVIESGKDPRKLGRWTWIKLQGENGISIRIVTIYRPVHSNEYRHQPSYTVTGRSQS